MTQKENFVNSNNEIKTPCTFEFDLSHIHNVYSLGIEVYYRLKIIYLWDICMIMFSVTESSPNHNSR